MREDHLIDAPPEYAYRLRAGAANVAISGWGIAALVVVSMVALPSAQGTPLVRTGWITVLYALWLGALTLWCKGWWRLTDSSVESLTPHRVVVSNACARGALLAAFGALCVWSVGAIVRGVSTAADPTLTHLLLSSPPAVAPAIGIAAFSVAFVCTQPVVRSLTRRTAPARPGTLAVPFAFATLPVGVIVLPPAMNSPSVLGFATLGVAIVFAFAGAQGAILRARIGRLLRERRRAEVLATRRTPDR